MTSPMTVRVRLFAILRERAGRDSIEIELADGATVGEALATLESTAPLAEVLESLPVQMAVNRDYAKPTFLALQADKPFTKASAGYAGTASDGLVQLDGARSLTEYDSAPSGNVVLTAALHKQATLALGVGRTADQARHTADRSLDTPYALSLGRGRPSPAALIALSGFIPTVPGFELDLEPPLPPVAIGHGSYDPVIGVEWGRRARTLLENAGAPVLYREYPLQHSVDPTFLREIAAWLPRVEALR